jgi:hypothetical protein
MTFYRSAFEKVWKVGDKSEMGLPRRAEGRKGQFEKFRITIIKSFQDKTAAQRDYACARQSIVHVCSRGAGTGKRARGRLCAAWEAGSEGGGVRLGKRSQWCACKTATRAGSCWRRARPGGLEGRAKYGRYGAAVFLKKT